MATFELCPKRIRYGKTDVTEVRCAKEAAHLEDEPQAEHGGPAIIEGQQVNWLPGDRREYEGDWPGQCLLNDWCILPDGHADRSGAECGKQ